MSPPCSTLVTLPLLQSLQKRGLLCRKMMMVSSKNLALLYLLFGAYFQQLETKIIVTSEQSLTSVTISPCLVGGNQVNSHSS